MKMKIIYFSGTGNTEFVSEKVKEELTEKTKYDIELIDVVRAIREPEILVSEDVVLGLSYPVYDYMPPDVIMDFIRSLDSKEYPVPVCLFSTYTTDPLDCNSHAIDQLVRKNYYVISECSFKAPGASAFIYSNSESRLVKNHIVFDRDFDQQVCKFTEEILAGLNNFKDNPFTLSADFHRFNKPMQMFSKLTFGTMFYRNLKVNKNCSGCGLCIDKCPEGNLELLDGKLKIKKKNGCHRCLGCVQVCSKGAINFTSSRRRGSYTKETIVSCYNNR